jgi:DDE superfamily endonuclease
MTRHYGRAVRGERVREGAPGARWSILTILGAMTTSGLLGTMTIAAATDTEVFLASLDQGLCPRLRPGQVVVMDNLAAHKVAGVRERIQAVGAQVLYLPPYSPDFNPIELGWSKIKQSLRAAKARTLSLLDAACAAAVAGVTSDNAAAWFRHCGYCSQQP